MAGEPTTYMVLMNLTPVGAAQEHPWDAVGTHLGGWLVAHDSELLSYYATLGPYDFAAVVRVADDESVLLLALHLAEQGYVTPMSLRAFDLQARELGAKGGFR